MKKINEFLNESESLNNTYNEEEIYFDEDLDAEPGILSEEEAEEFEKYISGEPCQYSDTQYRVIIDPGRYSKEKPTLDVGKWQRWLIRLLCVIACGVLLYSFVIYTNIPFIAKWRTLYIETAMSTMTHQWLATAFIPNSVIEEAMWEYSKLIGAQEDLETDWESILPKYPTKEEDEEEDDNRFFVNPESTWLDKDNPIYEQFPELDIESFAYYMEYNGYTAINDAGKIMIDESDRNQNGTSIRTRQGDEVLAVDEENGILIVKITGEGYMGRIAIVKDASRVKMGVPKNFGTRGSQIKYIASYNDAVLAINANGFEDPEGHGDGGIPYGYIVSDGEVKNPSVRNHYKVIGFDTWDRMYIGKYKESLTLRDAGEFTPALIINGEKVVEGSAGWGIQPRSAIGQCQNGDVLMLIIDGRQTHSVGATVEDAADQLLKYGAVQACNLDGGSSAVMYYNGRVISQPSAADKVEGRLLPCGFIVKALPTEE